MFKPLYMALLFFVLIGISIGFATADTHEPTERWEPRSGYTACMTLDGFVPRIAEYGGELVSSGEINGGAAIISVMAFPDNSFGVFIYDPVSGFVCNVSKGWFAEPGMPV